MIGWKELLILLVIVLLVFGTKRLKNVGKDMGEAIKGFKQGMSGSEDTPVSGQLPNASQEDSAAKDQHASPQDERTPR
jgi:sec-independent protein translocase protein TatA